MSGRYLAYSEYKDTRDTDLGHIPSHWHITKVKFISRCLDGLRIPLNAEQRGAMQGSIPYWGANSIVDYVDNYLFDEELVLLGEDGAPFFEPTKDVAFNVSGKIWPNNHVHVLRPDLKQISSRFLKYALNCVQYHLYITGSTRDKLNQSDMKEIFVRSCSVEEQEQIANFLDHETAKIDTVIDKQQQLIKLLKEKRQAVISHAVTKGLNPDAPMKDSGVEWLGEVPAHWVVTRAKYLFDFVTSGSRGWAEYYSDSGSLFFRIANLTRETIEPKMNSLQFVMPPEGSEGERSKIKVHDLLISITADLGSVCVADESVAGGYVSQHVSLCRPNGKVANSRWLGYVVLSDGTKEQFVGAGYGGTKIQLSLEDIREFLVVRPPAEEQTRLARYVDEKLDQYATLIEKAELQITLLQERRTALISAAVTGKIDVRHWQPEQSEISMEASA
jgi:type I restriction enzyme, S subunit